VIIDAAATLTASGESFPFAQSRKPPKAQSPDENPESNAQAKGLASASLEAFLAGERLTPSEPTEGASGVLRKSAPPISQVKRTEGAIAVRSWIVPS
jgi:hypothetical protein